MMRMMRMKKMRRIRRKKRKKREERGKSNIIALDRDVSQVEQYYCPYRGCDATPRFSNGIMLHIRRNHYAGCPGIEISNKRVYKTPSGDDLHLDSESCRNMLEPGDEISVIFLDEIGTWYCPYEGCNFAYVKSTRLRLHVNKEHNAEMELPGTGSTEMKYSTPSGEPIDFSSVSCRRMLKHGEKISVQFTPRKHIETLYCPYKGCTKKSANTILLHRHIRRKHCPELISDLRMLMNSHYICFTTPSGKPLHYDESCRDTVDEGEPIILKSISFKQKYTILCPYEGCTTFKKLRTLMYQHIRVQHDAFFPKLPRGPFIHSFTSPSGEEIKFDDHSRNSLKEGESISVTTTAVKKKYPTLDVDQLK
ncbi:hypothetical protein BJV82DRAFT_602007 [Fennellomyces sp. T-0311]|nr:hypothetical protein BJV82DRAFT_602007 [Fennellomyces sp. T-0311]